MSTRDHFGERRDRHSDLYKSFDRQYKYWSYFRLILTIAALTLIVYFSNQGNGIGLSLTAGFFLISFGLIVNRHNGIRYRRDLHRELRNANEREIQRLSLQLDGFDQGSEFLDEKHPFSIDLDIFGKHSLFQLINRTSTSYGRIRLAQIMKGTAETWEIRERGEAVSELSSMPDLCQEFEATGILHNIERSKVDTLLGWLQEEEVKLPPRWLLYFSMAITLGFIFTVLAGPWSFGYLLFPLLWNGILLSRVQKRMKELMDSTYEGNKALKAISGLIRLVQEHDFNSRRLAEIKGGLNANGVSASEKTRKLNRLLDLVQSRANFFYGLTDLVFLTDLFLLRSLVAWKRSYSKNVSGWFDMLAEMEALQSIAMFGHANPDYARPEIQDSGCLFQARQLGHPLIPKEKRVCNDVAVDGDGTVVLITGSNMSGKSTFLRTIGINLVLSNMGAPVCASGLVLSRFRLFTSMRTTDKLEESVSSFYAELRRIRQLLDLFEERGYTVMYMVDELLKGTNSHDRHRGSVALIGQLSERGGLGWVSTHDITLGELTSEIGGVEAMSFNSTISNDELIFDYRLTPGICRSFNASILMKKMGISIKDDGSEEFGN